MYQHTSAWGRGPEKYDTRIRMCIMLYHVRITILGMIHV